MAFRNFSFTNVNVIYGILELQEFGTGDDVVNIELDEDLFSKSVGAKGDVVRTQTNDNSCTITIRLHQTSSSNADLTVAYLADRNTGANVQPMIINDKEGGETYIINNAWISRFPTVTRGQNPNNMEWVFQGDFFTPSLIELA